MSNIFTRNAVHYKTRCAWEEERMIELKEFVLEGDVEILKKEWLYIRDLAENENGFTNLSHGISWENFLSLYIPRRRQFVTGDGLEEEMVKQFDYLLWLDGEIVGMYRIRPELNDFLKTVTGGHIGYGIKKEYRGKGLGTQGLKLALEVLKTKTKDSEAYLFVHKDNPASLKVMQKNGAYIHHETDENFCTRIKL